MTGRQAEVIIRAAVPVDCANIVRLLKASWEFQAAPAVA